MQPNNATQAVDALPTTSDATLAKSFIQQYSTDIIESLGQLSSDEVFTPPKVVNAMLDLLPAELWSNPNATFLDPATKSGVFLREIVKRLDQGLAAQMPDPQKRIDHILSKQVFGVAMTTITALLARRSVYCNRSASSPRSITAVFAQHANPIVQDQGNIRYTPMTHDFTDGQGETSKKCRHCGASQAEYSRDAKQEQYAYPFLHAANLFEYLGVPKTMKFDVIIGNPPYQLSDGGAGASAKPLYHLFVEQAKKLNPRYLCMIIPARWYAGGKGLDDFRADMLGDKCLSHLVDFPNAADCFPSNEIKGGVCYFLWDSKKTTDLCTVSNQVNNAWVTSTRKLNEHSVFIRDDRSLGILNKVQAVKTAQIAEKTQALAKINNKKDKEAAEKAIEALKQASFENNVSSRKPFGLATNFDADQAQAFAGSVILYANKRMGYVKHEQLLKNHSWVPKYKVLVSKAYNGGDALPHQIINKPILAQPNSACTETYLVMGLFDTEAEAANLVSYMETRLFRFLVSLAKITQDGTAKVYQFVPLQDFSEPWTDEKLYQKYSLTPEEIAYIESMIRPMGDTPDDDAANLETDANDDEGDDDE
jgi:site-specific DNA-methyltransferase (adenine-specific)